MGWTSEYVRFKSKDTARIREHFECQWNNENFQIIDFSRVGNTLYMAIEHIPKGNVFAMVVRISFEGRLFYWKDMEESMGPYYHDCPLRILKKLSPTDNTYALEWRKRCWEHHKNKKLKEPFRHGDILEFPYEIEFMDGYVAKKMILVKHGRATVFAPYDENRRYTTLFGAYRIRRWKSYEPVKIGNVLEGGE